jgi:hypothetical protein
MKRAERSLQIDENLDFQRREWRWQRVGWVALALFVIAAAAGVFGGGPLSQASAGAPDGALHVEYERFVRRGAAQQVRIRARAAGATAAQPLALDVSRAYYEDMRIQRVQPEPESVDIGPAHVTLRFKRAGEGDLTILIDAEPRRAGRFSADIRSAGGGAVTFRQFSYF